MPPKASKKGSAKNLPAATLFNKNWEAALTRAQFEEESWGACVSLVVGASPEDEELTRELSMAAQKPVRKRFTVLTRDSTLAKINELGNPRAKKPEVVPTFYEVTESAKSLLDAGEEIGCDLMAKILKFQLLQIKADDQQRREAEQLQAEEEEKTKANPPPASNEKGGLKVSDKKGKTAHSPVGASMKKTKLKRRDDIEPPKYINDEPQDGPQHYILLLGFYQPHLIGALDSIGVHVATVIKLCSVHTLKQQHALSQESSLSLDAGAEVQSSVELVAQAGQVDLFWSGLRAVLDSGQQNSKLHDVAQLSYSVPALRTPTPTQDPKAELEMGNQIFDGVANLLYDCLDWRRQHQHYLNNLKLLNVPTVVGSHQHPAEIVSMPRPKNKSGLEERPADRETQRPSLSPEVDMQYYCNLLNLVPPEACSVPLIMHCVLEQVVISTEQSSSTLSCVDEAKPHNCPGLADRLVGFMLQSFLPLAHTDAEKSHMFNGLLTATQNEQHKKRLVEQFGIEGTQKKSEHPLVIRHHDKMAMRLRDIRAVQGFDPAEVELSMMKRSPVWGLIQSVARPRDSNSSWMAIKQQLQHYCTDEVVSWPEVERLIHQSVFESMPLTRLDPNGVLQNAPGPVGALNPAEQQTPTVIPWDSPLTYAKQQCTLQTEGPTFVTEDPDNTEQMSGRACCQLDLNDIQSSRLRSLFDWHYTEHHSASILPQVLQLASDEYRCMDTFRGSHNNILYIFCHNPMSTNRQCKEFWDVTLHTDVKFRKYLEHVADNISDWTKEEELKREAMQLGDLSLPADPKEENAADCAKDGGILEPVIRKGSLKAWKLEQEQLKEEEMAKKLNKENAPKSKQRKEEPMSTDGKKSKPSSPRKSGAEGGASSAKNPTKSITTTEHGVREDKELHQTEEPCNHFTGYSMAGRLIHVSGRCQYLFPSDGGHITVENIRYVEGSSLMKVAVKKDGHHFYTHINQVVSENPLPQSKNNDANGRKEDLKASEPVEMKRVKQGSLSAVLDNGIRLSYSFYGPRGEYRGSPQETTQGPRVTLAQRSKASEGQPASISSPFNSLNLSVPNGLLLQFLREDAKDEQAMLVKQGFPLHGGGGVGQPQDPSLSKELSRVITGQGAVIRYMRDGTTEVLFADGSVSFSQESGPVWVPDSEVDKENTSQEPEDNKKEQSVEKQPDNQRGCWLTMTPSGARIHTVGTTHKPIPTTPLLAFKATDPITHEVMLRREDGMASVQHPDGSRIVEHADGTRITSFYEDRPPSTLQHLLLHTGEHPESVTFKSPSECACGSTECVCVTCCADSNTDTAHSEDICDGAVDLSEDRAGGTRDNEGTGPAHTQDRVCEHVCWEGESGVCKNGQESVLAENASAQNAKRGACASRKGSVSTRERVVLVEKEGCPTVAMYPKQHAAHVFLADGTVVTGNNRGAYQVFPSSAGLLHIQSDGKCVYSTDSLITPSPKGRTPPNQPGSYTMSHTDAVACDITDPDGNHFQVMEDGQLSVLNCSPAPSSLAQNEEEPEEEDGEMAEMNVKHREHCPRLFVVHEDGSGSELLSSQVVEELLYQAYSDPTIALQKEPLPDTQDEFGITILKPSHRSVWSQWLLGKQNPDFTPPNLRNRSWHDFPRVEKSPGCPFGADMGRGLTLIDRYRGSEAQRQPLRRCPEALEMRELHQHRPFTAWLKNTVDTRLKEYIESLLVREQLSEEMEVKDPRSQEESGQASNLLNLVLSFAEEENASHIFDKRTPVDIGDLYSQGVKDPMEQSNVSEDAATLSSDSLSAEKESKWSERLTQYRHEMCEERAYREALRKKTVVPFFQPENIQLYQNLLQHRMPNMRSSDMDLPAKSCSTETFLKDASPEKTPRPLNSTPSQSARGSALSDAGRSDRMLEKRPTNSTPQTAGESSRRGSTGQWKSVLVDVTGKPRRTKVRLPTSILGSKPCSVSNQQFLAVEEPVRRRCRTISLTDPSVVARGFQLLPSSVDFGTVQEGTSSAINVVMKNVGVDTCRFYVKQPPPATGLRVLYVPGPVAAGLHVELQVQLFAMSTVQAGEVEPKNNISQDIVIRTETDILYLPVTATILPESLYDIWLKGHVGAHNKKGSRLRQRSPVRTAGRSDDLSPF
uniref:sperm-associated antigen 17 isoform X5 n=1 Tax=Gasterosteus aculeatus aculeatus TaxID=481459 RepID=UPI001A9874BD|nr:sperm-associated antigen 17 isoform X5 [Gasterosteus aculeatus aculeatus]